LKDQGERETKKVSAQIGAIWESTRVKIWYDYQLNPYVKKRPIRVQDIFTLSSDGMGKQKEKTPQTVEEMKAILTFLHTEAQLRMKKSKSKGKS